MMQKKIPISCVKLSMIIQPFILMSVLIIVGCSKSTIAPEKEMLLTPKNLKVKCEPLPPLVASNPQGATGQDVALTLQTWMEMYAICRSRYEQLIQWTEDVHQSKVIWRSTVK